MENYLNNLFIDEAKRRENRQRNKRYSYKLYDEIFMDELKADGVCEVISRRYDRFMDCDILTCKDLNTENLFSCNQFAIRLQEIK